MMFCCEKLQERMVVIINETQYREIIYCKICYQNEVRILDR